jgi:hypothetical protein
VTEDVGRTWFDPYTPVPEPVEEEDEFNETLRPVLAEENR